MACEYKDILGEPNTGLHKYRFFPQIHGGFAAVDYLFTVIAAILLAFAGFNPIMSLAAIIAASIAIHVAFCVPTTTNWLLGLNA